VLGRARSRGRGCWTPVGEGRHDLADDLRRNLLLIQRRDSQQRPTVASIIRDVVARFTNSDSDERASERGSRG